MIACVIMHNMIIENERSEDVDEDGHYEGVGQLVRPTPREARNRTQEFREFIQAHHNITNRQIHTQLTSSSQYHKQANPHPTSARSYRAPLATTPGHVSVVYRHIHVVLYPLFYQSCILYFMSHVSVMYPLFYQSCISLVLSIFSHVSVNFIGHLRTQFNNHCT